MIISDKFMPGASKAQKLIKRFDQLKSSRVNWDSYWQELSEYFIPNKDNVYGYRLSGENKFNRLYDSTSVQSVDTLASALHGMLTNPSSVWFELSTGIPALDDDLTVKQYLQTCVRIMIETLNNTNFQEEIHETYIDLAGIGTTVLSIEEDKDKDVRFRSSPIYGGVIGENAQGAVDMFFFEEDKTLRAIFEEFGDGAFRDNQDLLDKLYKDPECKEKVIFGVYPEKGKYVGSWVLRKTEFILKEGRYHEFPYAIPRWTKYNSELYGRSPSMKALADVKMLNAVMKVTIRGFQKAIDPPLMIPDNGFLLPLQTHPGASNFYRTGMKDRIEAFPTPVRPDIGLDFMENIRERIREAFFWEQIRLINQRDMTATEVMQRSDENLRLLSPILGRLNNELLKVIVDRVFGILNRRGKLPPPPPILRDQPELKIVYTSQIAKAQRTGEANTLSRVIEASLPVIQAQPDAMDNFNGDGVVKYNARIFGLPHEMLRSDKEVSETRKARAEQQAQMAQAQQENLEADTQQKQARAQKGG